jgi:hypothetical protein
MQMQMRLTDSGLERYSMKGPAPRRAQRTLRTVTQSMFGGGRKTAGPAYICKDCGVRSAIRYLVSAGPLLICRAVVGICDMWTVHQFIMAVHQHIAAGTAWTCFLICSILRWTLRASPRATGAQSAKRPRSALPSTRCESLDMTKPDTCNVGHVPSLLHDHWKWKVSDKLSHVLMTEGACQSQCQLHGHAEGTEGRAADRVRML